MRSILSVVLVLLTAIVPDISARSAGCGKSPVASGTKSTTVNGRSRQYVLQVPANYNPQTAYKLIFGFHWRGGTMNNVAPGYYGLRDLARETAIFVAPNGLNSGWANSGGEDVTFTDQMVNTIMNDLCVDETQVFATGFSYGGGMSFSLACSRPSELPLTKHVLPGMHNACSHPKHIANDIQPQTCFVLLLSSQVHSSAGARAAPPRLRISVSMGCLTTCWPSAWAASSGISTWGLMGVRRRTRQNQHRDQATASRRLTSAGPATLSGGSHTAVAMWATPTRTDNTGPRERRGASSPGFLVATLQPRQRRRLRVLRRPQ
jgi:hypothetical protein